MLPNTNLSRVYLVCLQIHFRMGGDELQKSRHRCKVCQIRSQRNRGNNKGETGILPLIVSKSRVNRRINKKTCGEPNPHRFFCAQNAIKKFRRLSQSAKLKADGFQFLHVAAFQIQGRVDVAVESHGCCGVSEDFAQGFDFEADFYASSCEGVS